MIAWNSHIQLHESFALYYGKYKNRELLTCCFWHSLTTWGPSGRNASLVGTEPLIKFLLNFKTKQWSQAVGKAAFLEVRWAQWCEFAHRFTEINAVMLHKFDPFCSHSWISWKHIHRNAWCVKGIRARRSIYDSRHTVSSSFLLCLRLALANVKRLKKIWHFNVHNSFLYIRKTQKRQKII